jgi:microcystin-dependent protein
MHPGRGPGLTARRLGEKIGTTTVTLTEAQLPSHTHTLRGASTRGGVGTPAGNAFNRSTGTQAYQSNTTSSLVAMSSSTIATAGGGQAHNNIQPYLGLNFIIALQGIYPSRS